MHTMQSLQRCRAALETAAGLSSRHYDRISVWLQQTKDINHPAEMSLQPKVVEKYKKYNIY